MPFHLTRFPNQGFSLVEMLVSVLIFVFVILAVYSLFDQGQWLYLHSERRTNAQDNARVAMEQMERDFRMIGSGVPMETQEGASTTWTPFIYNAQPATIWFRGDIDNRNTRLAADATGSPLAVEDADAICSTNSLIVITKEMRKWAPLTCSFVSATSVSISSGTVPSYSASEGGLYTPEQVFYKLVRSDNGADGDTNDDGLCDQTTLPFCTLVRYEQLTNTPTVVEPGGVTFDTLATNIVKLNYQFMSSTGTGLTYPGCIAGDGACAGGSYYAMQRILTTMTVRDRASEAGKYQDVNLTSDVLVRDARY